ncbi:MAG: ROK family protein [Rhodothermales bacterium]
MQILGIDIGGSGIKGAPVDLETGELAAERYRIATPKPATPDAVAQTVDKIRKRFNWTGPIGCAFPARVRNGYTLSAANVDDAWIGTNAEQVFGEVTGSRVHIVNDADAAGVAEMAFGAGKNQNGKVMMFTFGTGIGSAMFLDQQLLTNFELGHLEFKGMDAEHYAADKIRKDEKLTWKKWAERVQEFFDHVEFLFSPDRIIIGGGVSKPKRVEKYFKYLSTDGDLVPAELGNEAGIVGAAMSAKHLL